MPCGHIQEYCGGVGSNSTIGPTTSTTIHDNSRREARRLHSEKLYPPPPRPFLHHRNPTTLPWSCNQKVRTEGGFWLDRRCPTRRRRIILAAKPTASEFEPSPTELNKNKTISIDSSNLEKARCRIMLRRMRVLPLKSDRVKMP